MLRRARKRRLCAVCGSALLLAEIAVVGLPATASAVLPGVPSVAAPSPVALASGGCRGAGARHASRAVLRRAMLCLVNQARRSAGRSPFRAERHLARAAARHAADMARRHYFGHVSLSGRSPGSRARAAGWHGRVSEVIAWGCGSSSSPRATFQAWLNSPPHRSILLGGGHAAGVGVKRVGGCGGRAFWVIDVG